MNIPQTFHCILLHVLQVRFGAGAATLHCMENKQGSGPPCQHWVLTIGCSHLCSASDILTNADFAIILTYILSPIKMSTTIVTTTQTQTQTQKQLKKLAISAKTQELIDLELKYCAGGFQPLPAFFVRGKGCRLWVSRTSDSFHSTHAD